MVHDRVRERVGNNEVIVVPLTSTLEEIWGTCLDVAPMEALMNVANVAPTLVPLKDNVNTSMLAWGFALMILGNIYAFAKRALMIFFKFTHCEIEESLVLWGDIMATFDNG